MLPIWTITPRNSFIQVYPYLRDTGNPVSQKKMSSNSPDILLVSTFFWGSFRSSELLEDRMGYPLKSRNEPPKKRFEKWEVVSIFDASNPILSVAQSNDIKWLLPMIQLLLKIPSICWLKSNHVCLVHTFLPKIHVHMITVLLSPYDHHIIHGNIHIPYLWWQPYQNLHLLKGYPLVMSK